MSLPEVMNIGEIAATLAANHGPFATALRMLDGLSGALRWPSFPAVPSFPDLDVIGDPPKWNADDLGRDIGEDAK